MENKKWNIDGKQEMAIIKFTLKNGDMKTIEMSPVDNELFETIGDWIRYSKHFPITDVKSIKIEITKAFKDD